MGETVCAQVASSNKRLKREGVQQAKPGKAQKGAKKKRFSFIQNYLNQDVIVVCFTKMTSSATGHVLNCF